jgi:hypothetical protein
MNTNKEYLIDWLQGTIPAKNRTRLMGLVRSAFGAGDFVDCGHGLRFYQKAFAHPSGATIGVDQRKGKAQAKEERDYFEMSGRVLGLLSIHRLRWLMRGLQVLEFRATRIDLVLDDFGWSYTPHDPHESYEAGNITGFRDTGRFISKGRSSGRGLTFSLGNRGRAGSGKHITFYDKNLESKGERNCVRLECSFYGDYGNKCFLDLCKLTLEHWPLLIRSYLLVAVDFLDRSESLRVDRCPRLQWWSDLIEDTIPLAFDPREKDPDTLARIKRWIKKQVAPSFSALFEILHHEGGDNLWAEFYWEMLFDGERRRNDHLDNLVNSFKVLKKL